MELGPPPPRAPTAGGNPAVSTGNGGFGPRASNPLGMLGPAPDLPRAPQ
eukprot:gene5642-biopygen4892